jgi:radical SAM superfamily enzyme YgiQ (UPF0313 family)
LAPHHLEELAGLRSAERGDGVRMKHAPLSMGLLYPSPYHVARSSLGYLQIHRLVNGRPGTYCERATLPSDPARWQKSRAPLVTIESRRAVSELDLIGISHSYELESSGIVTLLELCGLEPLAADRTEHDPLVVLGGPITFSNPLPSSPFADAVLLGEAEETIHQLLDRMEQRPPRAALLRELADLPGFYVPSVHGDYLPPIAQAADHLLPAVSALRTPHTELADMVLIEPERGCHRGCTFCVMRRSTNGGMRLVPAARVCELVPDDAEKVGLVGAAVTDHPQIKEILRELIDVRGKRIGISSLRADRLDDEFVGLLARGGYKSMTVALDAPSVRLRDAIEKNLKNRHVERAAELARAHGMRHLKMYTIVGLPDETDEDIGELIEFALSLRKILPVVIAVSPFVPKFHTPLADAEFVGQAKTQAVLTRLKRELSGKVEIRGPGAREAYVEYRLAQGGRDHARAAIAAAHGGGGLSAWVRALAPLPERVRPANFQAMVPPPTERRRYRALRSFS